MGGERELQDSQGPDCSCVSDRPVGGLGRDTMDGGGARLPARARRTLVPRRRLSRLSAAGLLLVVVRLRRLCAADLLQGRADRGVGRSEEHTSELQSLMRISYAVFCLTKK